MLRTCIFCGKEFEGKPNGKYCKECRKLERFCPICGKRIPYIEYKTCSPSCAAILRNRTFGNQGGSKEAREKAAQTMLERYGVTNTAVLPEFKEKARAAQIAKHGGEGLASQELKEKARKTCLERYGVENPFRTPQAQAGREARFGDETVEQKRKETCLERFGYETPLASPEHIEKGKKTCLEKYGVEHAASAESVKKKIIETSEQLHGGMGMASPEIASRIQETCMKKYGVPVPSKSPVVQEKIRDTMDERYGGMGLASPVLRKQIQETNQERYGSIYPRRSVNLNAISKTNLLWQQSLPGSELEVGCGHYRFDLEYNGTLVEINPTYTHNSTREPLIRGTYCPVAPKDYHLRKTIVAETFGKRCMHVWDWDNPVKVRFLLNLSNRKVCARKCMLREPTKKEVDDFLELYHLQGTCKGQDVRYGLYLDGQLISVMTFGKPRYNKKYEWELLRYASDRAIIGGAERLFTRFLRDKSPRSIISYCDRSKFRGEVYIKLGFQKIRTTEPACHWYNENTHQHFTDNLVRQQGADRLIGTNLGKGTNNNEILKEHGFVEVYDCGQIVFEYLTE